MQKIKIQKKKLNKNDTNKPLTLKLILPDLESIPKVIRSVFM
jgi:hypothetical protein